MEDHKPARGTRNPADSQDAELRRLDRERWLLCLLAPATRRAELFALNGFNLEIAKTREVVTTPILGQIRLQWWRDSLDAAIDHPEAPSRHPLLAALRPPLAEGRLDRARLHDLIDAREADLLDDPPATLEELEGYADATAGTLLQLHLSLLGVAGDEARRAARSIGRAYAMAGLMRAVPLARGRTRLFLPADAMAAAGLDEGAIGPGHPPLAAAIRTVAERAAVHLRTARALRGAVPPAARPALALARFADAHIARLARAGWDPFAVDPRPSGLAPLRLTLAALSGRY